MPANQRCAWVTDDPLYVYYHDYEWGIPFAQLKNPPYKQEDQYLFEMLSLEGAQAGLSWLTILKRRDGYRKAFDCFDVERISQYDDAKIKELLTDERIIRNKLKIRSVINNAKAFQALQHEYESFSNYLWAYVNHQPLVNHWADAGEVPAYTELSTKLSKDLQKRGFSFVGPTICYAFMQAAGLINDHTKDCFLHDAN